MKWLKRLFGRGKIVWVARNKGRGPLWAFEAPPERGKEIWTGGGSHEEANVLGLLFPPLAFMTWYDEPVKVRIRAEVLR